MSALDDLKDRIDSAIYTNTEQNITGDGLQTVLDDMVDTMGVSVSQNIETGKTEISVGGQTTVIPSQDEIGNYNLDISQVTEEGINGYYQTTGFFVSDNNYKTIKPILLKSGYKIKSIAYIWGTSASMIFKSDVNGAFKGNLVTSTGEVEEFTYLNETNEDIYVGICYDNRDEHSAMTLKGGLTATKLDVSSYLENENQQNQTINKAQQDILQLNGENILDFSIETEEGGTLEKIYNIPFNNSAIDVILHSFSFTQIAVRLLKMNVVVYNSGNMAPSQFPLHINNTNEADTIQFVCWSSSMVLDGTTHFSVKYSGSFPETIDVIETQIEKLETETQEIGKHIESLELHPFIQQGQVQTSGKVAPTVLTRVCAGMLNEYPLLVKCDGDVAISAIFRYATTAFDTNHISDYEFQGQSEASIRKKDDYPYIVIQFSHRNDATQNLSIEDVENNVEFIYNDSGEINNLYKKEEMLPIVANFKYNATDNNKTNPCFTLLWFSDMHLVQRRFQRIADFYDKYKEYFDDIISTGDITTEYNQFNITQVMMGKIPNVLNIIGNHEAFGSANVYTLTQQEIDAGIVDKRILAYSVPTYSQKQLFEKFFEPFLQDTDIIISPNKTYFYKDYPEFNIRIIGVNVYAWKEELNVQLTYQNSTTEIVHPSTYPDGTSVDNGEQETWLNGVLADAKNSGYAVLGLCHSPNIDTRISSPFTSISSADYASNSEIRECVQSFINGGGIFIGWLCGHTHYDMIGYDSNFPEQMTFVMDTSGAAIQTGLFQYTGQFARVKGTYNDDLFNIISIDIANMKLTIKRIGCNNDHWGRKINSLVYDYSSHTIIYDD